MAESETARPVSAGRGLLYISFAKLWFILGGFALQFALPYVVARAVVGQWGVISSWISPVNNVLVTATILTVSRFSTAAGAEHTVQRAALRMQVVVGGSLALAFVLGAPAIAEFQRDPGLVPGLRIVALVALCYSLYAVFVGAANGAREFHKQAGLDITYTALRATLVLGGAVATQSAFGAAGGFAAAAATILVAGAVVVGFGRPSTVRVRDLVAFGVTIAAYLLVINLLMFLDLWLLKPRLVEAAARAGAADPVRAGNEAAAIYVQGVQLFARIPYQLILAVTFVVFPLVSRATFDDDRAVAQLYVRRAMRYSLLAVGAMASAIAARPEALVGIFPREYLPGARALPILAFGYVSFSLFHIAGTILNGAGRTRPTLAIGAITLLLDGLAITGALAWAARSGADPMIAAAVATTAAMTAGLALSALYLRRTFGASLPLLTVGRAAVAAAAAIAFGRALPVAGKVAGLAVCAASGLVFLATLFATRELTVAELRSLRRR